jgi:hypothetical protein
VKKVKPASEPWGNVGGVQWIPPVVKDGKINYDGEDWTDYATTTGEFVGAKYVINRATGGALVRGAGNGLRAAGNWVRDRITGALRPRVPGDLAELREPLLPEPLRGGRLNAYGEEGAAIEEGGLERLIGIAEEMPLIPI